MFGCLEELGCLDVSMLGGSEVLPARSTSDGSADYYFLLALIFIS